MRNDQNMKFRSHMGPVLTSVQLMNKVAYRFSSAHDLLQNSFSPIFMTINCTFWRGCSEWRQKLQLFLLWVSFLIFFSLIFIFFFIWWIIYFKLELSISFLIFIYCTIFQKWTHKRGKITLYLHVPKNIKKQIIHTRNFILERKYLLYHNERLVIRRV
jgi:hypothetical protein